MCQKLHHTLLHHSSDTQTEAKQTEGSQTKRNVPQEQGKHLSHVSHPNTSNQKQTLLMTCQVKVSGPNGHVTEARALLDSAASTLLVMGRLVWQLPRQHKYFQVAGIGGKAHGVSHSMASFRVANSNNASTPSGCRWKVEVAVLPKVTTKLTTLSVTFSAKWNHLRRLQLADQ